jgi:peptidoglycan-associated lipoprotein
MLRKLSFAVVAFSLVLGFAGCKSAQKKDDSGASGADAGLGSDDNTMGDSDSGKAMGMKTIYFKYDSFEIDAEGKTTLSGNAAILKAHPSTKIQIEGHCDQRGGIQYNIALGEKRANAVKKELSKLGIEGSRIATISYGKERLVDTAMTDEAFAKNRRANFVITSK